MWAYMWKRHMQKHDMVIEVRSWRAAKIHSRTLGTHKVRYFNYFWE
jgi:hypothetical protein